MTQLSLVFPKHIALLSPDEMYERVDEALLIELKEDRRIERKPPSFAAKEIGDYICMWANTPPDGGILVIGIENDKEFSGCHDLGQDRLNTTEKCHYTYCPDARVDSKRVRIIGKGNIESFVVVFRVQYREDKVVRTASGHAFIRRGDSKYELKPEEIRELEIDKRQVDLEKELVPTIHFPADFDRDLIARFVDGVRRIHQPAQDHSDTDVLIQRRLGVMKGQTFIPNTACVLAFAKDPVDLFPGCQIKFLRVSGEYELSGEKYNVTKTILMEGPVPRLLEECAATLNTSLREFSRLGKDKIFYVAPEYPRDAWFEAIVNACVHRSYGMKNMNVFVKMFDDKLVIESPGGFPPLVTPENIYVSHHPRNPTLMRAMFYMGLVKEHSEGTKRMRDTMQDMQLPPPQFEQVGSGFGFSQVRVTLRNHLKQRMVWVDADVTKVLGENLASNLTTDEKKILNFVAENGKINITQCHRLITTVRKWHGAKKLLLQLVDKNLLVHVHSKSVERDSRAHFALPEAFRKNGKK
jgi:ATP-dependent DNA helicase RecG